MFYKSLNLLSLNFSSAFPTFFLWFFLKKDGKLLFQKLIFHKFLIYLRIPGLVFFMENSFHHTIISCAPRKRDRLATNLSETASFH